MINLQTATRADLEITILDHDLEDILFNGMDSIIEMETETIREMLTEWVINGNEATCK